MMNVKPRVIVKSVEISQQNLELILGSSSDNTILSLPRKFLLAQVEWNVPASQQHPYPLRRAHLQPLTQGGFKAVISLPDIISNTILRSIIIKPVESEIIVEIDSVTQDRLLRIFPETDEEYIVTFQSQKQRWGNRNTIFFVASQIANFYRGAPEHRIGATLVMAYKAVEIGNNDLISKALNAVSTAEEALPDLHFDWHPRLNREHLEISLLCARWHLQIAQGDEDLVLRTIQKIYELCQDRKSYWTLAYSACKSLLFGGWLLWRRGQALNAKIYWERCISLFKQAVEEADACYPVLFGELTHSLEAAHLAGICISALKNPGKRTVPNQEQILAASTRVPLRFCSRWRITENY